MATLKSSTTTQLTDVTECCICLKTFTDPRMLPCIHTFCFQCLQEMVDKSDKKPGDTILCPMCRKEFTIPSDGVQAIQKNVFLAGVIEVKDTLIESKVAVALCDVCKAKDAGTESNTSKATSRCLDCQENLCEDCSKMHKAFKISRNHKVKKIDGEAGEEEVIKTFNLVNCDIHRGKVLDYYCAECKKVVCVSCFVEGHKTHNCKDVNTVEDKFRPVIKRIADKMSRLAGELLARKDKSESKEVLLTNIGEREQEILQRSDELKKMIDQHTKLLISTLDEIKDRRLKALQARDDELDRHILIEESLKRYCDELVSKGSAGDVCRNKDELLRRAGVIEEDHESYMMRPRVSCDVAFAPSDLNKFLQNTNGSMIGSLKGNAHFYQFVRLKSCLPRCRAYFMQYLQPHKAW